MKQKFYSFLLTLLFGMTGMQVWAQDLSTTEIDGITYYEIGSAADLVAFANLVNGDADAEVPGQYGANAILTADIALTDVWETPIGVITGEDNGDIGPGAFTGIFDGQGHKITGFDAESAGHGGLFGDANGATIKDFSIWGKLQVLGGHGSAVIGYPGNSTISGVHSYLEVSVPDAGAAHVGGVVGSARGGNTITGCTFNGTMTIAAGSTDCLAGVVGYLGGDNILFCANYGTITFDDYGCAAGGIAGYLNNTNTSIKGCLNMGAVVYNFPEEAEEAEKTPKWGGAIVGRLRSHDTAKLTGNCWLEGSATGAGKDNNGNINLTQAFCFPLDLQPTGEVCYKLNGDQTTIGWYQTLGIDREPTLDATHGQVYMIGHRHCNGVLYEGYTFSNEATEVIQDDHNMVDGVCDYCGFIDWDAVAGSMAINDEGFYEIANGPQLLWFAKFVNNNHGDANAVLTADIDLAKVIGGNTWAPIGTGTDYKGTFDGKGFTISNFNVTSNCDYFGLFGKLAGGAVIKNFTIDGTLISVNQYVGVIGGGGGGTINISDIHSKLNITCSKSRHAGVFGFQSSTGTINIDRCIYSGTLNAGSTIGNLGGIVALTQNSTSAYVNITDCLFDGTILDDGGSNAGGILGYANKTRVTIKNCLSVGTVIAPNPSPFIGQLNASNSKWAGKNYYTTEGELVGVPGNGVTVSGTAPEETNEEQLANGEICWFLNEEQFLSSAWRQTLEEEPYPMPTSKGDYVYLFISGYDNINSDNIAELIRDLSAAEKEFIEDEDLVAYQVLIDAYKAEIESWESITDLEKFLEVYYASAELKESVLKSVESYKKYKETCEYAINYLEENKLEGEWTDFLKTYLQDEVEPNKNYSNGSYPYIMKNLNLDDEALQAEITFVNQMLENAIAGGLTSGTEITRLLANSDFAAGFEGWTTETNGISLAHGGSDALPILRGLGNGTFDINQTLTELPNGIYMMAAGGLFRSGDDIYNQFYAGQLYLNSTANYFMSPGEDVMPEEEAVPGVNCLGADSSDKLYNMDGITGWVPNGIGGCSVAYGAGRYQNFTATEVTDGNLTIGVRSLGTGLDNDWLPFGNLRVYYLGSTEEANEKLSGVLNAFADRAKVISNFMPSEDNDDYFNYPNISENLKDRIADAIEEVVGADTGEEKMKLINKFSMLFNEVHACRMAYIAMYKAANKMYDYINALDGAGLIDNDVFSEWEEKIFDAIDHYRNGDVSVEEALAITEEFNSANLIPISMSEDGVYLLATATDVRIFSAIVNGIDTAAKAVLTADIDMSEIEDFEPIGTSGTHYTGVFDGQGHAITGFNYVASGDNNGLFGCIDGEAVIKNFRISGTLTSDGYNYNGLVGQAEGNSKVIGIYSDMDIYVSNFKAHTGGIVGGCTTASKILVENCEYAGTLTHEGAGDCQAGILGYTYAGGVRNCVFSGTIVGQNSKYGGILGYCKIPGFQGVQNCLSVGKIVADENCTTAAAIIANWNGGATQGVKNNYYCMQEGTSGNVVAIGNKKESCEAPVLVTAEQLRGGEICYKLNGDQTEINWYQTLGEDTYPVPFDTSLRVWFDETAGTYTNVDPAGLEGDLNGDQKVDIADAVTVLNIMAAGDYVAEADVNNDQKVDIADFVTILNIMAAQ